MKAVGSMRTWLWTALHPDDGERWWGTVEADSEAAARRRLAVELCAYWRVEGISDRDAQVWAPGGFVVAEKYL